MKGRRIRTALLAVADSDSGCLYAEPWFCDEESKFNGLEMDVSKKWHSVESGMSCQILSSIYKQAVYCLISTEN